MAYFNKLSIIGLLSAGITSCGGLKLAEVNPEAQDEAVAKNEERELVPIEVSINRDEGLGLTAVTQWTIDIRSCASGLEGKFTQADTTIDLYKNDTGCKAELDSFYDGTETFTRDGGAWDTAAQGEIRGFTGNLGTELDVTYSTALGSPITVGSESLVYTFQEIEEVAADSADFATVVEQTTVSISGTVAPSFEITDGQLDFVSISAGGIVTFRIQMLCNSATDLFNGATDGGGNSLIDTQGEIDAGTCEGITMAKTKARLMRDDDVDQTSPSALSTAMDDAAAKTMGAPLLTPTEIVDTTTGAFYIDLDGPGKLLADVSGSRKNLVLVLILEHDPGAAGGSDEAYQVFNIDVQDLHKAAAVD